MSSSVARPDPTAAFAAEGVDGGLPVSVSVPTPTPAPGLIAAAALATLGLGGLAWHAGPGTPLWTGLVVAGISLPLGLALQAWRCQRQARQQAEANGLRLQRLTRRDQQLRHAEQVAQVGSFDLDLVNGILHWSDGHFRLWGLAPAAQAPLLRPSHEFGRLTLRLVSGSTPMCRLFLHPPHTVTLKLCATY